MTTRIKLRRDLAANWTDADPTLAAGEPGLETDTGKIKYGDGETAWTALDYAGGGGDSLTDDKAVTVTVGNTDYFAIINRANNNDDGVESSAVAYDSEHSLIMLHMSEVYTGDELETEDRLIISKFSNTGTLMWQKQIQEDIDISQSHDVCVDPDDNIIVVCSRDGGIEDDTVQAIKFTPTGTELWKKDYHPSAVVPIFRNFDVNSGVTVGSFGGNTVDVVTIVFDYAYLGDNTGWSLQESTDNGTTFTTIAAVLGIGTWDTNADTTPLYIAANSPVEIISGGSYRYRVTRQGVNSFLELSGAVTDGTHTFIAANYQEDNSDESALSCLMKISNTNGNLEWAKSFSLDEGGPILPNEPYGMEITASGDLVMTGAQYTPGPTFTYVSKFSGLTGSEIWTRLLTNEESSSVGGDVTVDSQGNVFVSINGRIRIVHEEGDSAFVTVVYITKLNSSGVTQWTRRIGPGPCASVGTGIDSDSLGNVYLSALTLSQKNPTRDSNNLYSSDTREVLAIAKYSTTGAVVWQRYIEADGYRFYQSKDNNNNNGDPGDFSFNTNSGRNLAVSADGKIAVQVTVKKRDLDDSVFNTRYWESITFQIDQDGREMTIGSGSEKFTVKASRIPGKLVTLTDLEEDDSEVTPVITDFTADVEVTTPTITYALAELAQQIIKSAPYEYVFGNDGTLTIPNDGDVKLTQTQIGWFSIFGPANNYDDDVWIRASCVDTATGDVYVAGQEDNDNHGFVARYNSAGEILWSIILYDNNNDDDTRCNAIKMNPVTGNVTVLAEYYGSETAALVVDIDPDTATVVNTLGFQDFGLDAGVNAYDFDFQTDGSIVVVGRKYDERKTYSVTPLVGSTDNILIINRSEIGSDVINSAWRIAGTDITGLSTFDVNFYPALTGTVRQGSGAEFDITNNGNGTYSVLVTAYGPNYLAGHKIRVVGTDLGGATPDNDCIITVVSNDVETGMIVSNTGTAAFTVYTSAFGDYSEGGVIITEISPSRLIVNANLWLASPVNMLALPSGSLMNFEYVGADNYVITLTSDFVYNSGDDRYEATFTSLTPTAPGPLNGFVTAISYGVSATYNLITGTNYQTGSGLIFDFTGPQQGTNYANWDDTFVTAGGTNYVDGDVVTISGALLDGISTANDLTAIVQVFEGAVTQFSDFAGTGQNTTYRITPANSQQVANFGGVGTWTLSYPLGGEAFVWTNRLEGWSKIVGGLNPNSDERYFSVAVGSDGSIYAAGEIYTDDSTSNFQAVVSKFNSSGAHQWSRALNTNTDGASAKCVAVRGTTVAVSSYNSDDNDTIITKLDTSGDILWQRRTDSNDDSSVAIDTNGDIYAVAEANLETRHEDVIKVIRFASNGEPIWRKFFGTLTSEYGGTNEYFKNGRNLTLDAEHFYVSGYTTAFDNEYESGFLVKLPKSGDCDGYYGAWTVQTDAYNVLKVNVTEANTFTPNIGQGNFALWTPDFLSNWWDSSDGDSYYQTLQPIVDRDGGAIEFADGTRQTTSAQQIPQIPITNGADHRLCLDDMGKHIYVTNPDTEILVPYHLDNPLPIGFTVVIINNSGGSINITGDGGDIDIIVPGLSTASYWSLDNPGMATMIKVDENDNWFMTGNVTTGP